MTNLLKEQILKIPELKKTMTTGEIAKMYKTTEGTIYNWIRRLKKEGYKISKSKSGRKAIVLK